LTQNSELKSSVGCFRKGSPLPNPGSSAQRLREVPEQADCPCPAPLTFVLLKGDSMNTDILKGKWTQVKGSVRSKWGKITDNDVVEIQGDTEKMIGKLQERYGYQREQAEKELQEFLNISSNQTRRSA
jgi:uncharacterized protein YjbJ (UPF0337 family)